MGKVLEEIAEIGKNTIKETNVDLSVVIPMYNEADNVTETVVQVSEALSQLEDSWEILLVNDGSTDRTLQVAQDLAQSRSWLRVVSYSVNGGRGKALKTGFSHARGDIIVSIDADLSYEPKYILDLVRALKEDDQVDFVLGSPYVDGGGTKDIPWDRLFISRVANKLLSFALSDKAKVNTITGIFRAYRRPVLESLELESDGKEIHLEIISKALAMGYKVKEVPAILRSRKRGMAKFTFRAYLVSHLLFSFFERPVLLFGIVGLIMMGLGFLGGLYLIVLWQLNALNPERPLMTLMMLLILTGTQFLSFGFLGTQLVVLRKEIYKIQRENKELEKMVQGLRG